MRRCKRCHAPDKLNTFGLCPHCMQYIKNDLKKCRKRLGEIYEMFPESADTLDEEQTEQLLHETHVLFECLEDYHGYGCTPDDYVLRVEKILHFLTNDSAASKRLLKRARTRKMRSFLAWLAVAALLIGCSVAIFVFAKNNPETDSAILVDAAPDYDQSENNGGFDAEYGDGEFDADSFDSQPVDYSASELDSQSGELDLQAAEPDAPDNNTPAAVESAFAGTGSRRVSGGTVIIANAS